MLARPRLGLPVRFAPLLRARASVSPHRLSCRRRAAGDWRVQTAGSRVIRANVLRFRTSARGGAAVCSRPSHLVGAAAYKELKDRGLALSAIRTDWYGGTSSRV